MKIDIKCTGSKYIWNKKLCTSGTNIYKTNKNVQTVELNNYDLQENNGQHNIVTKVATTMTSYIYVKGIYLIRNNCVRILVSLCSVKSSEISRMKKRNPLNEIMLTFG